MPAWLQQRFSPLALVLAVLVLVACAPMPKTEAPTTPAFVTQAQNLEHAGDYQGAAKVWLEQAAAAVSPDKQHYQLRAVSSLLRGNLAPEARRLLASIELPVGDEALRLQRDLLGAQVALLEGDPEGALALAAPLSADLSPILRAQSHQLRAEAYLILGNLLESARERILLEPLLADPLTIHENRLEIWNALSQLSAEALLQLQTEPPPDVLSGWMELAFILKKARLEPDSLHDQLAAWRLRYPTHPAAPQLLAELLIRQQQIQQRPGQVALLLPLSGDLATAGKAVRDGFIAAHYHLGPAASQTSIRVYDTAPYAGDAIWNLYDQALREGASFIVGPLEKDRVNTLARADGLTVPTLALNYADGAQSNAANIFQFGLAPEDEARQIAERAIADGLTRSVALVPEGEWGERVLNAFSTRFHELGGQVLAHELYNSANSDFSQPIRRILNLDASRGRHATLRRLLGTDVKFEPRRRQDIDFVFMAAFPRQARLIAPQLRFFHAGDLPVYATSHVYAPGSRDDRDMDGVIFCDTPWTLGRSELQRPLRNLLQEAWPHSMERYPRLFALGIDAYNLMPFLFWLKHEPYERFNGETGHLHIDETNRVRRGLEWARFVGGNVNVLQQRNRPAVVGNAGQGLQSEPLER